MANYYPQHEVIGSDIDMNSPNDVNKNCGLHFKHETGEYHIMEPNQINSVSEPSNTEVLQANIVVDGQLAPLGEKSWHQGRMDSSGRTRVSCAVEDVEKLLETRLQTMEKNLTLTITRRIKKMGKRMMKLQKSMLSDIFFLYKEQPDVEDIKTEPMSAYHQHQSTTQLPEIPINSVEKFTELEQKLKSNAKLQNVLISSLLGVNCSSPGEFLRICWSKMLTDEVAANFSWSIASTKNSICNRLITKTIKKAFALKFPLNQEKFNIVTQKYFQYAKERSSKLELNSDNFTAEAVSVSEEQPRTSSSSVKKSSLNTTLSGELGIQATTIPSAFGSENESFKMFKSRKKSSPPKNPPKTGAQRSREYRLRIKRSKTSSDLQNQSQSNDSSTSVPFIEEDMDTMNSEMLQETDNYSKSNDVPETSIGSKEFMHKNEPMTTTPSDDYATKVHISGYGYSNQPEYDQSSRTNDDTSQEYSAILYDDSFWKSSVSTSNTLPSREGKVNGQTKSKPIPKTSAERSRAYRIRKRIQMAAALQREQLESECFANADPLSYNTMSIQ